LSQDNSATQRHDGSPAAAQLAHHLRFEITESRFALVGKDRGNRFAGALLHKIVRIDPIPLKPRRKLASDGRFARPAIADQENGRLGGLIHSC
jgi:hypothetical protein